MSEQQYIDLSRCRGDCPNCGNGVLCVLSHGWVCLKCRVKYTDKQLLAATKARGRKP